ncbi:thymidylate synthase [Aminobacter anthyllidis]|uniref:Thymidylate synthase n=1 Tax=Aminobacter anthyllidis TaxID=1035067 RepID=A0A9X1AH36_9HYPH|nr:thymidylate synthase [Aminobacter anthyllidis]MBT1159638.1 thymidylate synthase [Aminobacter anthyllidis]
MKTTDVRPVVITADNLSLGWARVLSELCKPGVNRLAPLTLTITGFDNRGKAAEVPAIRDAVDAFLDAQGRKDTENVAWTIFPQRYLELADGNRDAFFELFIESFQRVQEFNPRNNKRGSYFQRLVDLNGGGKGPNQLKWMLDDYDAHPKARRTSKFQATTFDPTRDYSAASLLEFPCLQQVSFVCNNGALAMNGFYATQQIARKAYGNYLGLSRLGAFMAHEMKLRFEQLNIFVGVAQMDIAKSDADLQALLKVVRPHLDAPQGAKVAA